MNAIEKQFALARRLTPARKRKLARVTRLMMKRLHYEGCQGLRIDHTMRILISAQLAYMFLGRTDNSLRRLKRICLYPGPFRFYTEGRGAVGRTEKPSVGLAGHDFLSFSWPDVTRNARDPSSSENAVFHEAAHLLDLDPKSGDWDGVPYPRSAPEHQTFLRALQEAKQNHATLLDDAEFFSVCVERFFLRPEKLYAESSELYAQLCLFFVVDPRQLTADLRAPRAGSLQR